MAHRELILTDNWHSNKEKIGDAYSTLCTDAVMKIDVNVIAMRLNILKSSITKHSIYYYYRTMIIEVSDDNNI